MELEDKNLRMENDLTIIKTTIKEFLAALKEWCGKTTTRLLLQGPGTSER